LNPKAVRKPSWDRFWIGAFFSGAVLQLYHGYYLGWFLGVGILLMTFWGLVFKKSRRDLFELLKAYPLTWGLAAILSGLALWPLAQHYLITGRSIGFRTFNDIMFPGLQSWFYMGQESWLYGWTYLFKMYRALPLQLEQSIGLGLVTTFFVIQSLIRQSTSQQKNPTWIRVLLLAMATLFLAVTVFPPRIILWKYLFPFVPGAEGIRALQRAGLLMLIPAAYGMALTIQRRKGQKSAIAILLLLVLEQGHTAPFHFDKYEVRREVENVASQLKKTECDAFIYAPVVLSEAGQKAAILHPTYKYDLDAMWVTAQTGIPTLNGYSGNSPPGWGFGNVPLLHSDDEVKFKTHLEKWIQENRLNPERICWLKNLG